MFYSSNQIKYHFFHSFQMPFRTFFLLCFWNRNNIKTMYNCTLSFSQYVEWFVLLLGAIVCSRLFQFCRRLRNVHNYCIEYYTPSSSLDFQEYLWRFLLLLSVKDICLQGTGISRMLFCLPKMLVNQLFSQLRIPHFCLQHLQPQETQYKYRDVDIVFLHAL